MIVLHGHSAWWPYRPKKKQKEKHYNSKTVMLLILKLHFDKHIDYLYLLL